MLINLVLAQPRVGDHGVELGHYLGLGHHRQPGQVSQLEPAGIHPAQAAGVERRMLGGMPQQRPQPVALVGGQLAAAERGVGR